MCGRFSLSTDLTTLKEKFQFIFADEMQPRYNIAPGQTILTVVQEEANRVGKPMRWGLVPFWAKDHKIGYKMINARAETIHEKPSYRHSFQRKRCLILADGFYEWKKEGAQKKPFRFQLKNREPFAFAGAWDRWSKGENTLFSCTIITTTPNDLTKDVHDRMPVILPEDAYDLWLNPDSTDTEYLKSLLLPYPSGEMESYAVSTLVNSPKNDHPAIIEPLKETP